MSSKKPLNFYDAYQELEQIANDMQQDPARVIDVMEEKLQRAIELNKFCSERLGKVQAMLDEYQTGTNMPITNNLPSIKEENVVGDEDDDIPF